MIIVIIFIAVLYLYASKFILFCIIYVLNLYPIFKYHSISLCIFWKIISFLFIDIGVLLSWKIFEIDTFMYEFKEKKKRIKKRKIRGIREEMKLKEWKLCSRAYRKGGVEEYMCIICSVLNCQQEES